MKEPNLDFPKQFAGWCQLCGDSFKDKIPWGMVREWNTNPSHPDYQFIWVCRECFSYFE